MKAPTNVSARVLAPAGTHVARVVGIIYLGTVDSVFDGEKKAAYKVRLTWELPNELHKFNDEEKPFVVSKEFTFSFHKKSTLRPFVEGIIGTSLTDEEANMFDLDKIMGEPCQLTLVHAESDKGKYVQIKSVAPLMKGVKAPAQINPSKILGYSKEHWDEEYFSKLPDFIKSKMKETKEYRALKGLVEEDVVDEEIPF